jgi:hypothetical protein
MATARSASWYRIHSQFASRHAVEPAAHLFLFVSCLPLNALWQRRNGGILPDSRLRAPQGSSVLPALVATGVSLATQKFANGGFCRVMCEFLAIMIAALAFCAAQGVRGLCFTLVSGVWGALCPLYECNPRFLGDPRCLKEPSPTTRSTATLGLT